MTNSYSVLAKFYDRLMTDYKYDKMCEYIINNVKGKRGLDLACGSGRITIELALEGFFMTGIDKSLEMLNCAASASRNKGVKVIFAEGDVEALELSKAYDFIIATCDVINYINPDNFKKILLKVYEYINCGGSFIFDFSSSYKLTNIVGNNVFYEDYEDMTYIWDNSIKGNSIDMDMVFFLKDKDKYKRLDEHHTQYIYDTENIVRYLSETGFNNITILDGDTFMKVEAGSLRILIRADKK